jgi:hypothetical protein
MGRFRKCQPLIEIDLHALQRHVETQPIIQGDGQEPSKLETDVIREENDEDNEEGKIQNHVFLQAPSH